jgi:dTDP-4-amino-4,6-dideoxygalactose transaminase
MKEQISGNGYYTKLCESRLAKITHANKILMTNSCTSALEMSCLLLDLKPGDEVILPSFTFVSTANAVVLRGATPVFCDIRGDTLNLDEEKLQELISNKTKAIIPVHYAGQSCEMHSIIELAKRYGLSVIEDAAQSVGAYHHGQHAGTLGDLGCFSFHETKNIMCGEGGALAINNPDLIERAEIIREKGTNREAFFRQETNRYTWVDIGSSYLPSELQMAFLFAQLENLDQITAKRKAAVEYYYIHLRPLVEKKLITIPKTLEHNDVNYHLFAIICRNKDERDSLLSYLRNRAITSVFHYIPLHSSPAGERYGDTKGNKLSVTEHVSDCILRIPVYFDISTEEQSYIVHSIYEFFQR